MIDAVSPTVEPIKRVPNPKFFSGSQRLCRWLFTMGAGTSLGLSGYAQPVGTGKLPKPPQVVPPKIVNREAPTNSYVREVGSGLYEVGNVLIDKAHRSVSFPAVLNMNKGLMEYFLVTSYGKTHESVLRTEASPYQIHLAMLLLGVNTATNQLAAAPPTSISNPSKEVLPGDKVSLSVSWTAGGKEIQKPAEELVFNRQAQAVMEKGAWVYNGSAIWNGTFLAQREGSIVSLVTDASALINNAGSGHDNDHIWTLNTNSLPPFDVPLKVTLTLINDQPRK